MFKPTSHWSLPLTGLHVTSARENKNEYVMGYTPHSLAAAPLVSRTDVNCWRCSSPSPTYWGIPYFGVLGGILKEKKKSISKNKKSFTPGPRALLLMQCVFGTNTNGPQLQPELFSLINNQNNNTKRISAEKPVPEWQRVGKKQTKPQWFLLILSFYLAPEGGYRN